MRTPTEHIKTLQRRVDFLKAREHRNSYDAAELGSLEWALVNLSPQRKPLTRERVKQMVVEAGYDNVTAQEKADFINGIRHGEAAHGIKE